jgi:hypothetical protein
MDLCTLKPGYLYYNISVKILIPKYMNNAYMTIGDGNIFIHASCSYDMFSKKIKILRIIVLESHYKYNIDMLVFNKYAYIQLEIDFNKSDEYFTKSNMLKIWNMYKDTELKEYIYSTRILIQNGNLLNQIKYTTKNTKLFDIILERKIIPEEELNNVLKYITV